MEEERHHDIHEEKQEHQEDPATTEPKVEEKELTEPMKTMKELAHPMEQMEEPTEPVKQVLANPMIAFPYGEDYLRAMFNVIVNNLREANKPVVEFAKQYIKSETNQIKAVYFGEAALFTILVGLFTLKVIASTGSSFFALFFFQLFSVLMTAVPQFIVFVGKNQIEPIQTGTKNDFKLACKLIGVNMLFNFFVLNLVLLFSMLTGMSALVCIPIFIALLFNGLNSDKLYLYRVFEQISPNIPEAQRQNIISGVVLAISFLTMMGIYFGYTSVQVSSPRFATV